MHNQKYLNSHSYNIEVTGTLSVDGYAVKTGLQVSGAIHSSTGAELEFSVVDKNVELNLNLPLKKQEIFNFNHKIIYVTQERGKESVGVDLKFSSKKYVNLCSTFKSDQHIKLIYHSLPFTFDYLYQE